MKKRFNLQTIALLMIVLVLTLAINSSIAFAGFIGNPKIYGQDKIDGYARIGDSVTVEANVNTGGIVTPAQMKLGTEQFDSCIIYGEETGKNYNCKKTFSLASVEASAPINYKIILNENSNSSEKTVTLAVDSQDPTIPSFSANPKNIGPGTSTFSFTAADTSCPGCSASQCIGIQKVVLYEKNNEANKFEVAGNNDCVFSSSKDWEPVAESGNITICAKAIDRFSRMSAPVCDSYEKKVEGPSASDFVIVKHNTNYTVSYVGPTQINADITAYLSPDSVKNTVKANFSELNIEKKYSSPVSPSECITEYVDEAPVLKCAWENILIKLDKDTSGKVIVSARDSVNNLKNSALSFNLKYDNTAPSAVSIKTLNFHDDKSYVGSGNNTFVVEFAESGSGFSQKNVFLDLNDINSAYPRIGGLQADGCFSYGSSWLCAWHNITTDKTSNFAANVYLIKPTSDDALNEAVGENTVQVSVDVTAPVLKKLEKRVGNIVGDKACPVAGDILVYKVSASDDSPSLLLFVNASELSNHQNVFGVECVKGDSDWLCEIGIDSLKSGYINKSVYLILEDAAGNQLIKKVSSEVCESDASTSNLNFVSFAARSPATLPGRIDRKFASVLDSTVFVPLYFSKAGNVEIMGMRDDNCAGTNALASEPYILNPYSETPYLVVELKRGDYSKIDSVMINCTLELSIRKGHKVYVNPEKELVQLNIPFYNLPLGQLDENIQRDISSTVAEINSITSKITGLEKRNQAMKKICDMIDLLSKLERLMSSLSAVMQGITCGWFLGCGALTAPPAVAACRAKATGVWQGAGCRPAKLLGDANKLQIWLGSLKLLCAQQTCAFCNPESWANLIADLAFFGSPGLGGKGMVKDVQVNPLFKGAETSTSEIKGYNIKGSDKTTTPGKLESKSLPLTQLFGNVYSGDGGKVAIDPFHDIHSANSCGCIPGKIYNYEKLRQIKCMYVNCVKTSAEQGISTAPCAVAFKERECLYFEGANSKKTNLLAEILKVLPKVIILKFLQEYLAKSCPTATCATDPCGGTVDTFCFAINFFNSIQSFITLKKSFDMSAARSKYTLNGPDACAGIEGVEPLNLGGGGS